MPDDQEFRPLERVDPTDAQPPVPARAGAPGPVGPPTGGPPRRRRGWRLLLTGPVIFLGWVTLFVTVVVGAITLPDVFRGQSPRPRSLPTEPGPAAGEPPEPPDQPQRPPRKKLRDRLRPPQLQPVSFSAPARPKRGKKEAPPPPAPAPVAPVTAPVVPAPEHVHAAHGLGHVNGHDNGNGLKMGHVMGHGGKVGALVPVPEVEFAEAAAGGPGNGHGNAWGHTKH